MNLRKKIVSNSLSGVFQAIVNVILVFTVVPIFISKLGIEEYGLFSLIIIVGNLNVFTNLGLSTTLLKFISEQGKIKESNYDLVVAVFIVILFLVPILLAGIIFNKFILINILGVPTHNFQNSKILYLFLMGANFFLVLGQIFKAVLDGLQRIVLTNFLQILYNIIYWILILFVLLLGYHLPQIGMVAFLSAFIWFILIVFYTLNFWGTIKLDGLKNNFRRVIKKQISYAIKIYATGLISFFSEPLMKIIISNFIGISDVGFYDIALRFRNQLLALLNKLYYPLLPVIAGMKNIEKIKLYVDDIEKKALNFIIPLIIVISYTTIPFVKLWIGKNVDIISFSIIALVSAYLIFSITVVPNYQFLITKGYPQKTIILKSINVFTNIVLTVMLFNWLEYYSVIFGNVMGVLSSFLLSQYYQKKYLDSFIFDNWKQVSKLLVLAVVNLGLAYLLNLILISNWAKLIIIPIILSLSNLLLFRHLKLFTKEDIFRYLSKNIKIKSTLENILIKSS